MDTPSATLLRSIWFHVKGPKRNQVRTTTPFLDTIGALKKIKWPIPKNPDVAQLLIRVTQTRINNEVLRWAQRKNIMFIAVPIPNGEKDKKGKIKHRIGYGFPLTPDQVDAYTDRLDIKRASIDKRAEDVKRLGLIEKKRLRLAS